MAAARKVAKAVARAVTVAGQWQWQSAAAAGGGAAVEEVAVVNLVVAAAGSSDRTGIIE